MPKEIEKIKKQLLELADVVNEFISEKVQVVVIDRLLAHLDQQNKQDQEAAPILIASENAKAEETVPSKAIQRESITGNKKPGATRIIHQLLQTEFFDIPRTLTETTDYINENFDSGLFYTYQTSGILLGLFRKKKLTRISEDGSTSYKYVKVVS